MHQATTREDLRKILAKWYDGYSSEGLTKVYNPFFSVCEAYDFIERKWTDSEKEKPDTPLRVREAFPVRA
jgi:hypothetical protein